MAERVEAVDDPFHGSLWRRGHRDSLPDADDTAIDDDARMDAAVIAAVRGEEDELHGTRSFRSFRSLVSGGRLGGCRGRSSRGGSTPAASPTPPARARPGPGPPAR